MQYKRNATGYTLIELLLYITLTAMLLSSLAVFFAFATSARVKNQSIMEVDQQGQFISETISAAVRNADSVTTPALGASGSQLILVTGGTTTTFTLTSGVLYMQEGAAAATALSSSKVTIGAFTVKNVGKTATLGSIQTSLTLNRVTPATTNEYDYQKTFITTASMR